MQFSPKSPYSLLLFAALILAAVGGYYKYARSALPPAGKELVINVVPLEAQDVRLTSQYVGYVTPIKSVEIVPNVSGYIDEVWAEGGQTVAEGDNLVLIDQREYKAQLNAAAAAAAQAKADFDNAKTYYNRMKKAGKKAVSASELDQAKAQFLAADAALQQAEAEQQKADVLYNYTVLQAPISGIVGDVTLTKGDYVAPGGTSLFSIIQFDPIRVKFAISDKEYLSAAARAGGGKLFAGEDIQIRLADGRIYPAAGVFRYTDNQVDKSTNSVTVFADFANTDKQLLANSYVDVLLSKQMKDIFLVRQNYATLNDKGAFVYVMQKGNLKQVPLKIAGYLDDYYITENKFAQDEYLVVDKIGRIAPGTKLKMRIAPAETEEK